MNFLQSFLFNGYLMSSELCIKDIAQERAAFTDVTKAFIFSALYRRFDCETFDLLTNQEIVSRWNRQHPRLLLTYERRNNGKINQLLAPRKNSIDKSQKRVIEHAISQLTDATLYNENPEMVHAIATNFLVNCSSATKLLFYLFNHNKHPLMLNQLSTLLAQYLRKIRIADYFSMLLIELTLQVSMQHGQTWMLDNTPASYGPNSLDNVSTYVIWSFSQRQNIPKERVQLRVALSNKKSEFHNLHTRLTQDTDEVLRHANIQEYYLSNDDPAKDRKLGLTYLSYVENECKNLNLHFESFISTIPDLQQALYNVSLLI